MNLRLVEDEEESITSSRSLIHTQIYKEVDLDMFLDDSEPGEDSYARSDSDYGGDKNDYAKVIF